MPEGHHLHRLALDVDAAFAGRAVAVSSPQGRFADSAALLDGRLLSGAVAHGKHLFVGFGGDGGSAGQDWLHVHLGLIGSLRFTPLAAPVGQVRVRIADDTTTADLRGPQVCRLLTADEVADVRVRLGPDPLQPDADPDRGWQRIRRSGRPIGALLMDQTVLSGVGNIYRAEVLFRQRIAPLRPGSGLKPASWRAIWSDLVALMPQGVIDNRIDTIAPEHTPEAMGRPPRIDDHGGEVYVYRRAGLPCWVCGSRINTRVLEGRNLYWCGRCQRRS